jgi:hypothetical protein
MNSTQHRAIALLGLFALAAACHKDERPMAYGGGPGLQANIDNGIARIAAAKCDRAARCEHIMPGKKYDSREQCESVMRGQLTDDIRLKDCRGGIDEPELQECIREVNEESCNNPVAKLGSHTQCRVSQICLN